MNKKTILPFFLIILWYHIPLNAQKINPVAIKLIENGQEVEKPTVSDTLIFEGEFVGSATMKVLFNAQVETPENYTSHCEWQCSNDMNYQSTFWPRYDMETEYTFEQSGTYYVRAIVTFTNTDDGSQREDLSGDFVIKISESELKVPNAFSPNGDGINDVFKVTYKSLVKFDAYIFNRWGQELYHWGLNNIDEGWDGTAHGKQVKDGVYFIVVEAEGSDGIKYRHKGDINILRGYSGTGSGTNTPATR